MNRRSVMTMILPTFLASKLDTKSVVETDDVVSEVYNHFLDMAKFAHKLTRGAECLEPRGISVDGLHSNSSELIMTFSEKVLARDHYLARFFKMRVDSFDEAKKLADQISERYKLTRRFDRSFS